MSLRNLKQKTSKKTLSPKDYKQLNEQINAQINNVVELALERSFDSQIAHSPELNIKDLEERPCPIDDLLSAPSRWESDSFEADHWESEAVEMQPLPVDAVNSERLEDVLKSRDNHYRDYENYLYLYFSEVGQYKLLTAREEQRLGVANQAGDSKAFSKIVLGNLRLVVMIAQRYENRGLDLSDLISEGNLGLMHATRKYDPHKGCRFSTYAVWWIRHYIEKALMNQGRTVRLPIHINKAFKRLMGTLHRLTTTLNREPTVRELSEETGQTLYEVMDLLAYQRAYHAFNGESSIALNGRMIQEASDGTVNYLIENETFNLLESILLTLEPNERALIECRFGMNGRSTTTLDKTGEVLGLTRDQVRYLQMKTLEKMRLMLEANDVDVSDILE